MVERARLQRAAPVVAVCHEQLCAATTSSGDPCVLQAGLTSALRVQRRETASQPAQRYCMAGSDDPQTGTPQAEEQTWLQRKVTGPLYGQIAAGVTPVSLAQSVAMGLTVGIGPLPCLSGIIVGLLSVYCGYNMVAGQVAQLVMAPIQLAMIVPFMRFGEWMTGWEPTLLDDITRFTEGDILGSLGPLQPSFAFSVEMPLPFDLMRCHLH